MGIKSLLELIMGMKSD